MECVSLIEFSSLTIGEDLVVLDIETKGTSYYIPNTSKLMGIGLYFPKKDVSCFIPFNVYNRDSDTVVRKENKSLEEALFNYLSKAKIVCHNSNFDLGWLNYHGIPLVPYWDTRVAWQILSPETYKETNAYSLDKAIEIYLGRPSHKADFELHLNSVGARGKDGEHYKADQDKLAAYCEQDCKATYEVYTIQKSKIEDLEAYNFMATLFRYQEAMWPQLWKGIPIDSKKLNRYEKIVGRYTEYLHKQVYKLCTTEIEQIEYTLNCAKMSKLKTDKGKAKYLAATDKHIKFNMNSRAQVSMLLEFLGIRITEKTDKGKAKTNKDTLNKYKAENPVVEVFTKINDMQTRAKFITQYKEVLINDRYHPEIDILGAASGRHTCFAPNILALNRRDSHMMRCFVAPQNKVFVQWDLSNIEPRIECHFSRDKELADIVMTGKDIYLELLKHIYPDKIHLYDPNDIEGSKKRLSKERDMLKKIRLAMGYGAQPNKVSLVLNIAVEEARRIYNAYWTARKSAKNLENRLLGMYNRQGHIKNMWQRPLVMMYVKDILNRFIQSSAHDTLMMINLSLQAELKKSGIDFQPIIMDFHDENITMIDEKDVDKYKEVLAKVFKDMNAKLNLMAALDYDTKVIKKFSELK